MRKYLLLLWLILLSIAAYAQPSTMRATYQAVVATTPANGGTYAAIGFFLDSDGLGYTEANIKTDTTMLMDNRGYKYRVVYSSGGSPLTLEYNLIEGSGDMDLGYNTIGDPVNFDLTQNVMPETGAQIPDKSRASNETRFREQMLDKIGNVQANSGAPKDTVTTLTTVYPGLPVHFNGATWELASRPASKFAWGIVVDTLSGTNAIIQTIGRANIPSHGFTVGQYYSLGNGSAVLSSTIDSTMYDQWLFNVLDANTLDIKLSAPVEPPGNAAGAVLDFGGTTPVDTVTALDYFILWDSLQQQTQKILVDSLFAANEHALILRSSGITSTDDTLRSANGNFSILNLSPYRGIAIDRSTVDLGNGTIRETVSPRLVPDLEYRVDTTITYAGSYSGSFNRVLLYMVKTAGDTANDTITINAPTFENVQSEWSILCQDDNVTYNYVLEFADSIWIGNTLTRYITMEDGESFQAVVMDDNGANNYRYVMADRRKPSELALANNALDTFYLQFNGGTLYPKFKGDAVINVIPNRGIYPQIGSGGDDLSFYLQYLNFYLQNGTDQSPSATYLDDFAYASWTIDLAADPATTTNGVLTLPTPTGSLSTVTVTVRAVDASATYDAIVQAGVNEILEQGVLSTSITVANNETVTLRITPTSGSTHVWTVVNRY